jgi:hypothetical protein
MLKITGGQAALKLAPESSVILAWEKRTEE